MKQQLEAIEKKALEAFAAAADPAELESLRVKFLGKKGELTAVLKMMGSLSPEERPVMGQMANQVRAAIEKDLEEKKQALAAKAMDLKLRAEALDVTMPGTEVPLGHKHPMSIVLDEMKEIFIGMGFDVVDGPEVELESYNFTKLNTPGASRPGPAGHLLHHRGRHGAPAHPDLTHPDPGHGDPEAPHPYYLPRPGLPEGRGGRHPQPHVPSDGGTCHRQGHHHG